MLAMLIVMVMVMVMVKVMVMLTETEMAVGRVGTRIKGRATTILKLYLCTNAATKDSTLSLSKGKTHASIGLRQRAFVHTLPQPVEQLSLEKVAGFAAKSVVTLFP